VAKELMPILNYSTSIAVEKTVGEIQGKLAQAGAQAVLTEYGPDSIIASLSFRIDYQGADDG
jgi:hypothetical protein